ncbi:MAG TPA: hypothetical protein VK471_00770 [Solirubrobacterales bacterium]|nr:hypothetical protein [Solirubrobacterales bacterium]
MVGTSLLCNAFIESESFEQSKAELKAETGLTDREIDDRLEAVVWALRRNTQETAEQIPGLKLWVVVTERGLPELRIYLRPRDGMPEEAEWLWIERRP